MLQRQSYVPDNIYALADHLDAALAACEDLLRLSGRHADLEWYLASVRRFELAAILQVLRVRQYAEELRGTDARLSAVAELFLAGTVAFTEANGAQVNSPFAAGGEASANRNALAITDEFTIGRRIPIGALADMVGAFLNALEITYVLYDGEEPRPVRPRITEQVDAMAPSLPPPLPRFGGVGLPPH